MTQLKDAFNGLLKLKSRKMTLSRPGGSSCTVYAASSNYSRILNGPGETVIYGREFVITRDDLKKVNFPLPLKRGDRLQDEEFGIKVISEVEEMIGLGGEILGYRIRTS
jgi:hypothetical protein